ncbi:MAG: hypothetical protein E7773_14750 [Sphingomonas sp.]|uniref:RelA/SpoT domain-containing protein n=1 Tax=Sphingomonas sp. TaxID=28214 RepID=UPI0011FAA8EF|nr:RelA/SpoT domain-containing protein [Sphingomonas sp.]THD34445.1 MAG: hypothetical protein E7773_14750 [Sphingomonas sp.]
MTFEDYRRDGRTQYQALVESAQHILRQALVHAGLSAHSVTGRAKDVESLRKKLADRSIPLDQPMDEIKDLAGCRIVFLTNSQVDAFNRTGALHENFEVVSVNVHHPVPGTDTETKLFDSTNYLVRLKPERLALVEYRAFDGIEIEIQVQTLLNHAWAEMGHDTIYKEPKLVHLGAARMTRIGERMNKVMQDHLVPAGHDFDKIARDFHRLLEADGAADATLATIRDSADINQLDEALETFVDLVLPHYDEPAAEFSRHLEMFVGTVERARDLPITPIQTQFGDYPGKSALDAARHVARLIRSHRYWEPDRTFHALVRLYVGAGDEDERKLWVEAAGELAQHNLDVWQRFGPVAQRVVLDELRRLGSGDARAARPLLVAMLAKVLSADLEGATWRSDSVTIHQGSVLATDDLRAVRGEAIDWLERWLDEAEDDVTRLSVLQALGRADAAPMHIGEEGSLMQMLLEDGTRVARLVLARVSEWGLELRRGREVDALHTHYRFLGLRSDLAQQPELVTAQQGLLAALLAIRDTLAEDADYVLYKTLVGHDTVRPDAWDGDHFDFEATDLWRRARFPEIIEGVSAATRSDWMAKIDRYVDAAGNDGGHFAPMREFLGLLAEYRPDVAVCMLGEVSQQRAAFGAAMLGGLDRAGRGGDVLEIVDGWIRSGTLLPAVGDYLQMRPCADLKRLREFTEKAVSVADARSAIAAATVAAVWYQREPDEALIETVLMPVVRFAIERAIPEWISQFWTPGDAGIVRDLNEDRSSELLASFVGAAEIDYRAVRLLIAVGRRFPKLIIDFYGNRITRELGEAAGRFEPIPFHSHDIGTTLSPHAGLLVPAAREWYRAMPRLHEYRGGRLIHHVFPELPVEVAELLSGLAREGDEDDLKFVLKTLAPYEGTAQIYPVCMDVVARLEPGDKMLDRVTAVLGETGVVSGEFGFVEVHAARRELIGRYQDDTRDRVRQFARDRVRELTQHMAWEQRRAGRDVAQRRRDWNEE